MFLLLSLLDGPGGAYTTFTNIAPVSIRQYRAARVEPAPWAVTDFGCLLVTVKKNFQIVRMSES